MNLWQMQTIRIYSEPKGTTEISIPRITDRDHMASRVMTNGDCKGRIFLSHPRMINLPFNTTALMFPEYVKTRPNMITAL